jgi:hypothetical protein
MGLCDRIASLLPGSLPIGGIPPGGMANIRGWIGVSIAKNAGARLDLIWPFSVFLFWYAWRSLKGITSSLDHARDLAFGNFVLVAILVRYHFESVRFCVARSYPSACSLNISINTPASRARRELRC